MSKKLTLNEFIERAVKVHENKYDYSLVEYKSVDTKVKIICSVHGIFEQSPKNHMKGQNCKKCMTPEVVGNCRKRTNKDFIKKCKEVHGDKYDYSEVNFVNKKEKIKIICKEHGEFYRFPYDFINNGYICPCCKKRVILKDSQNKFLEKYKKLYGEKYTFPNLVYTGNTNKINVLCEKHGEFKSTPVIMLSGANCPKCKIEKQVAKQRKPFNTWKEKCNIVHNNKYTYPENGYTNSKGMSSIICPIHGEFKQEAYAHSCGRGCSKCAIENKVNYNRKEVFKEENKYKNANFYVIELYNNDEKFIKVGITKNSIKERYYGVSSKYKYNIKELLTIPSNIIQSYELEFRVLNKLKNYKYIPLTKFPGYKECLAYHSKIEIMNEIKYYMIENSRSNLVGKILHYEYNATH